MLPTLTCAGCAKAAVPQLSWQQMSSGAMHLRADCGECHRWIKFVEQSPLWLSLAPVKLPDSPKGPSEPDPTLQGNLL